ncbi:hypothetical protein LINPERHAP1_LOCUS37688, partial [Linum perenne]
MNLMLTLGLITRHSKHFEGHSTQCQRPISIHLTAFVVAARKL